jgi:hypothetical protein
VVNSLCWIVGALLAWSASAGHSDVTTFATPAAAVQALLASHPRMVAFGEYHQQKKTAKIPSALRRFTTDILPVLAENGATDLVAETWVATGSCGTVEHQAVAQVHETTRRPQRTEDELVTMLRRSKGGGLQPRILQIACTDYQAMMHGGRMDFDRLLRVTRDQLETQIRAALERPGSRMVVSYGGALHNDREPTAELAPYAFGPTIAQAVADRYLEIDLYVPEYIARDKSIQAQPWYQRYRAAYQPGHTVVVARGRGSYALIFPRQR